MGKDYLDPTLSWKDIEWLRSFAKTPVLLKGILNPDDAEIAVKTGVSGIFVSNHGARNLDTVPATIDALPSVVEKVAGRVPVIVDGGIRRGTDVLKALALGAAAVGIGRPYLYGLGVAGSEGVTRVIQILRKEFEMAMMLTGRPTIASIDRSVLWPKAPLEHFLFLDVAHFIDDALKHALHGLGAQGAGVVAGDVREHLVFTARFVDRQRHVLLDAPDLLDDARPFVQQGQQLQIQDIDLLAAFGKPLHAHWFFDGKPLASCLAKASRRPSNSGLAAFSSIVRTIALPTTTPSAIEPTARTCSAVEIPNPTASGSFVTLRIAATSGAAPSDRLARSPVTPVRETR